MRLFSLCLIFSFLLGCSSSKQSNQTHQGPKDSSQIAPPAAIKDNLSLIGAVITAIDTFEEYQYHLHIDLRTAVPEGSLESIAEPGQQLEVVPAYRLNEQGKIDMEDKRNQRLTQVRSKKVGDFLFGKISLQGNGIWYLHDREVEDSQSQKVTADQKLARPGEPIPPNTCRIVGTIVGIDSTLERSNSSDPCSKVPCRAAVRVDSILGYGQAFGRPLSRGEKISVKFVFTLSPTKDLIPNMSEFYPGLHVGSIFLANVESTIGTMGDKSNALGFLVYGYKVR